MPNDCWMKNGVTDMSRTYEDMVREAEEFKDSEREIEGLVP